MTLDAIHIRDPFVLPVPETGLYHLYGTNGPEAFGETATGFDAWTSRDLVDWEGPTRVFVPPPGFPSRKHFWAPEVHRYEGRYFLFASFLSREPRRGTAILVADSPLGPFRPHSRGAVTPGDAECLDGTLFLDDNGAPWIVFCHEWLQIRDGAMCAQRLRADLTATVGPVRVLFRASAAPWVCSVEGTGNFVTDGPWLLRGASGALGLLWSSYGANGYALALARSPSGSLVGPWEHPAEPVFTADGGHGMTFRDFSGEPWLALHQPNQSPHERPRLRRLRDALGQFAGDFV